ncbi:hypothetical protein [Cellulophaga tyrosinoxydans]|uniref:Uncharacterized protein n=1 Tax=Cellulophaga tyrosinoxydans TaxID=504486 RepID=A0A1W1YJV8_9FLAO|nr:hypothetical protein [Cellulophaga tyrosinoxydans]SMC36008.1 hypothetical protein SAMN05660703_0540 [Cellulophaga tyrosinoxydans]
MKKVNLIVLVNLMFTVAVMAQVEDSKKIDSKTYYEQRAEEDAKFEQSFVAEDEKSDEEFWETQKQYENDLKKRDRKAYKAYMKGKKDAYAEHYNHCDDHCHHSHHYYSHATFYYYGYNRNYYRPTNRTTVRTNVGLNTSRIRVGLF